MRGAFFETWVLGELLKSWWHQLRTPRLYFYRDRDGKEIDFLFEQDRTLYPVEVKLGATPWRDWARPFRALDKLDIQTGPGAVVCLYGELLPLTESVTAVPAGAL